jgi:hypothetical protein
MGSIFSSKRNWGTRELFPATKQISEYISRLNKRNNDFSQENCILPNILNSESEIRTIYAELKYLQI